MAEERRKKVMIVDDDRNFLNLVRDALKDFPNIKLIGHLCFSGYDVIEDINIVSPDILFLDVKLPDCSGAVIQSKLKKVNVKYPIYLISAWKKEELPELQEATGADKFIHKSNFIEELLPVLTEHFGSGILEK